MPVSEAFADYFRCPNRFAEFDTASDQSSQHGYFRFRDAVCYGQRRGGGDAQTVTSDLPDASRDVTFDKGRACLPFDLTAVVTNLRQERYHQNSQSVLNKVTASDTSRGIYYFLRPLLTVSIRKHLQKIRLSGWDKIPFPRWPVDCSVEALMQGVMELTLKNGGPQRVPFIWFWPEGLQSGCVITHDVEGPPGQAFSHQLMDLDDSFGFKSAFQVVPEIRSEAPRTFLKEIRSRGFEGNVHDLNHDGYLFDSREQFEERARKINGYIREFESRGFRAGAMHRVQDWFGSLDVSFDMSVPNVAHLEPQRGGCCTVMPYFIGNVVELPLTTIQDYSLFHILDDYSTGIWKKQIDLILSKNGLITILTHPDYLIEPRARAIYAELLALLRNLREERRIWAALPGDVERWWRSRSRMSLVPNGDSWRIEGPESHRARLAYATIENENVVYKLDC
jgi:hypothetical protein